MFNLRAAVCLLLIRRGGALLLLTALGLPAISGTGLPEPSAAMTPVARPLPPDAPREGQNANEMDEIRQILDFHYHFQRLDGRNYGLPENDFDDATNISLRQRRAFRQLYPDTTAEGIYQYPRWAYDLLRRLDAEGTRVVDGRLVSTPPASPFLLPINPENPFAVIVGANINVTNNALPETESYLAIDQTNQRYLIGSSNNNGGALGSQAQLMYRSADWGATWATNALPIACSSHSDPGGAFDSLGNAYSVTLEYLGACGNTTKVNVYQSTDKGATWSAGVTISNTRGNDKELMAVDYQPASPCRDRLYVAWDDRNSEKAATAPNYSGPWTISGNGLDSASIGTDIAVGPGGEVYDVWANTSLKQINFSKSTNCGGAWSAKQTIAATADGYDYGIPAMCSRRALIYPAVDVDRSNSPNRGNVYVVWNDFTVAQGAGCIAITDPNTANVYLSRSTNGGTTWSAPKIVHQDIPFTDQFNQWMRVDDADGCIHISWHDTRNDLVTRAKSDVYYTRSCDGGITFDPETKVSTEMTDESAAGANPNQYGDYEGLAVLKGVAYPFWTDRRPSLLAGAEQIFTAKICSDPKNVGAIIATDLSACAATGVAVSWTAPTVFWGDGGAGTRKYQLFKDGVLAQDNIAETATSLTYIPGDSAMHSYVIKAVNSCGNTVSYAAASAADLVDITPPGPILNSLLHGKSGANLSMTWAASPAPDLNHYNIYGTATAATYPTGWAKLGQSLTPAYSAPLINASRFYLVSAVDNCSNESIVE